MSEPSFFDDLHKFATKDIVNFVKRIWNGGKVKPINGNYVNYHDQSAGSLASYCTIDETKKCYATEKNPLYVVVSTPQDSGLDGYFKELNIDIIDRKAYIPETKNNIIVEQNELKYDEWAPVKLENIKVYNIYDKCYVLSKSFNTFFNNNIDFIKERFFVKIRDHYQVILYPRNDFFLKISDKPRESNFSYFVSSFKTSNGTVKYFETEEYKNLEKEWKNTLLNFKEDEEIKKALVNLCFTWDFEDTYNMLQPNSRKIIPRELKTPPERCCYY
jgi:hypothetical protein